jgi:hypothetical protein
MKMTRAQDLQVGDQVILTLTVGDISVYKYRREHVVSFGDEEYNLSVNVDGNTLLPVPNRHRRRIRWWRS